MAGSTTINFLGAPDADRLIAPYAAPSKECAGNFRKENQMRSLCRFLTKMAPSIATAAMLFGLAMAGSPQAGAAPKLSLEKKPDAIAVMMDGRPLTTLHFGEKWDKPFLHPLRSSSGVVISRGFPLDPQDGESNDHAWHRGIWYGHGDVSGEDFWRELGADKSGRLVPKRAPEAAIRDGAAVLRLSLDMVGRSPEKKRYGTLNEEYTIRVDGPLVLVDAVISVWADAGVDLRFGDTDDGGFGFRLADIYREDRGAALTNSEGGSGTKAIWGKSAKWVDYSAEIGGKQIGLAVLDHPSNVRYPQGWHARGYALSAANPFALGSFAEDKKIDGSYTLKSGDTFTLRYRVVIHEGAASAKKISGWQKSFAASKASR